jgi:hypothetical protein
VTRTRTGIAPTRIGDSDGRAFLRECVAGVVACPESIPEEDARVNTAFLLLTSACLAGADPVAEPLAAPKTAQAPAAPAPTVSSPIVESAPIYEESACKPSFFARLKAKFAKPKHEQASCACGSSAPVPSPAPTALPAPAAPEKVAPPAKLPAGEKEKTEATPDLKGAPVEADKDVPF